MYEYAFSIHINNVRGRTQIILLSKAWEKYTKHVLDSEAKIILKSAKDNQKDITRLLFKYLPGVIVVHSGSINHPCRLCRSHYLWSPEASIYEA